MRLRRRRKRREDQPDPESPQPALHLTRALVPFVRPHWRGFVPAIAGVLLTSSLAVLKPWPLKFLVDGVLDVGAGARNRSLVLLVAIGAAIVGIAVLQGLFGYLKEFFLSATAQRVAYGLRVSLFDHMQRLSLSFHDKKRTGDLMTRVTNDVTKVQELVTDDLMVGGATAVIQLGGMLTVMLVVDWPLGLVAMFTAPLIVLTSVVFRRRIRAEERRVRQNEGDIASLTQEAISSIRVVKSFGREDYESARFEDQSGQMLRAGVKVTRLEAAFSLVLGLVTSVGLAVVVVYGGQRVLSGALSAGTLIVFIQYMRDLQSPLTSLSKLSTKLAKASVRARQIVEILEERPAIVVQPHAQRAPRFAGRLELDRVTFGYAPGAPDVRDVSLTVVPGQCLALVGPTGAGKSTVASLVLRLYDPWTGVVRIDGHDVRDLETTSVLDQISVVLQESLLFQTSVAENIAYGRPGASQAEVERAARVALAHDFVRALPEGYDTVVGERGTTLSGGQRQRIAIARAVVRDAPILVLDEPTTGLDAQSETIVMRAIARLMEGRSTLLVTHRLSAVEQADQVVVMEAGGLVERGTPAVLAARGEHFRRLFGFRADAETS